MMDPLLEEYAKIAGMEVIDQLCQLAKPLKGLKIVHINSTKAGGGVAEILNKMVPLTCALGIDCSWDIIEGSSEFYHCTKSFHNALQGMKSMAPANMITHYEATNAANAEKFKSLLMDADVVFIHDPQPLPLITHFPERKGKWIWRCHIDASNPFRPAWKYLKPFIEKYDATIFSLAEFTHALSHPIFIILPSIDPLSEKNAELTPREISEVYKLFNLDPDRPIVLQVSRFDRFKDPLGVIECYRMVKKFNPAVQLVLAGSGASDDPEGEVVYQETHLAAGDDKDIHILLLPPDAHLTINALQRAATIVIQKSIKEGFGLVVAEAMWKTKPVIGGNVGGIKKQLIDGVTGYLINTPEGAASKIRLLLHNPDKMAEISLSAKKLVRDNFLITRHLREYLTLIHSIYFGNGERIEL